MVRGHIPSATVSRLPVYLRCLDDLSATAATCSSEELASLAGANSAQVRKDLSYLGTHGVRGVGYNIEELRGQIRQALGLDTGYAVVIVGAGNLGSALSNYDGFSKWGFEVAALIDNDPEKIGNRVAGRVVEPFSELEGIVTERRVSIGVIATPAAHAQAVADRLAAAGVRSILNFAPTVLQVPAGVEVRRVDLSTELQILSFHLSRDAAAG
jgi:redox-sensing transcriptional repressor